MYYPISVACQYSGPQPITLLLCMFCRSLFVLLCSFFWPLCCLFFFDIQIMITFLLSSNSSYTLNCPYTAHIYLAHSIKPFEITEGEIKHGQSRDACNINHTRHRTHKHTHNSRHYTDKQKT